MVRVSLDNKVKCFIDYIYLNTNVIRKNIKKVTQKNNNKRII